MEKTMKKILTIFTVALLVTATSCREDFEVGELSFPPNVIVLQPAADGKVPVGNFDVLLVVVDGPSSPLQTGSVVMKDAADEVVFSLEKEMSGIRDTLLMKGDDFNAASLGVGEYKLQYTITDTRGLSVQKETKFEIVNSLYVSNETEMYIAGEFNGWGSGVMTLVANYTWEIKNIDLQGGKFKFKNREDWSDTDWGDVDCDGVLAVTTGGGPDTDCGYSGLVNVRFNDETLEYTIEPAVNFASNVSGLFVLGSMNNFSGPPDFGFSLVADNTWELAEIRLKPGDMFKFAETKTFQGKNFGDAEFDGKAEEFGANIVVPNTMNEAIYKITFNDKTLLYTIDFVRGLFPDNLYLVGGSTAIGWSPENSLQFMQFEPGHFEIYAWLDATGGGFKFLQVQDWAGDWGADGANPGKILQEGEANAEIAETGFYRIRVNFNNASWEAVKTEWGVIGDATPGGWDNDTDMTFVSGTKWEIDITLTGGSFKFRANDDWGINLGQDPSATTMWYDEDNLSSPGPGDYHIEIDLDPVNGYTYTITPL